MRSPIVLALLLSACVTTKQDDGLGESVGSESAGSESAGSESAGSESAGSESAGSESAGSESAGSESAGSESAGSESAGSESAGSESDGSELAGGTMESTSGSETGADPFDFPPVECGDVTCDLGLLCVEGGAHCNEQGMMLFPAPACAPVPESCMGLADALLNECLTNTVCAGPGWLLDSAWFDQGFVACPDIDADCG